MKYQFLPLKSRSGGILGSTLKFNFPPHQSLKCVLGFEKIDDNGEANSAPDNQGDQAGDADGTTKTTSEPAESEPAESDLVESAV